MSRDEDESKKYLRNQAKPKALGPARGGVDMKTRSAKFSVSEMPDSLDPYLRAISGGNVKRSVWDACSQVLRTIAGLPPDSACITLRYKHNPKPANGAKQSRGEIDVITEARTATAEQLLQLLIGCGPLSPYYKLRKTSPTEVSLEKMQYSCDIVRKVGLRDPLVSPDLNDKALPVYHVFRLFKARNDSDGLALDRALDKIAEPVVIDFAFEPTSISGESQAYTRYLARLQAINRSWEREDGGSLVDSGLYAENVASGGKERVLLRSMHRDDPVAEEILRSQQHFHESFSQPHLQFHIRVFSESEGVARMVSSVLAESVFANGDYQIYPSMRGNPFFDDAVDAANKHHVIFAPVHRSVFGDLDRGTYNCFERLPHLATFEELSSVFRLPVSSYLSPLCMRKNTDPDPLDPKNLLFLGYDMETGDKRGLIFDDLCKHLAILGMPGVGKTSLIQSIIIQASARGIPVLILEGAKTEYRILKTLKKHKDPAVRKLARALRIFTPGKPNISPLFVAPLALHSESLQMERIEALLACLMAIVPVSGSLPALLGEALEQVYADFPNPDTPPLMSDLLAAAKKVLRAKGYSGDTFSDFNAAIDSRLGTLCRRIVGLIFRYAESIPSIDSLVSEPSVIEMHGLTNEGICFLALVLLTLITELIKATPSTGGSPRLIIIVEEAHRIVGRLTDACASEGVADPRAFASQLICEMLAELRALKVGIIVCDQHPSAVAREVIKTTASKVAFRQVDRIDREDLGNTMLLNETEMDDIVKFGPGEAFFFTEGYKRPRRIRTENLSQKLGLGSPPLDRSILPHLEEDAWFVELRTRQDLAELDILRRGMDQFDEIRAELMGKTASLLGKLSHGHSVDNPRKEVSEIKRTLMDAYKQYLDRVWRPLSALASEKTARGGIGELISNLTNCHSSVMEPDTMSFLQMLERQKKS